MDRLDIAGACNALPPFIEALNNWYIRRSRERFWTGEKDADKRAAYDTLYTVLVTLCRTMAPFLPYRHRAHPPRARRTARACTCRTGRMPRRFARRPGAGRADGPRARGLLGGGLDPHGEEPPQPPAAPPADRRASAPRDPRTAPRRHRRGGQRQGGRLRRRPAAVRRRGAGGQSAPRRQAARAGDEGRARRREGGRAGSALDGGAVEVAGQRIEAGEYELRFRAEEGLDAASFDGIGRRRRPRHDGRSPRSSARAWRAISSASSRSPARTPASTSPTASTSR